MSTTDKIYQWVTERIITQLEKGTVPWHCPWVTGGAPKNFKSKKAYRGFNVFMLSMAGYSSPYWMTRPQILAKSGNIRKGEKSSMVTFWKFGDKKKNGVVVTNANGKAQKSCILRYYNVWNVEQTTGIDYPKPEKVDHDPIESCDKIVAEYENCPQINHGGNRACYIPLLDTIKMPPLGHFAKTPEYYSTLFHEMGHSTGHKSRLDRNNLESGSYSFEELIAEMTAAMLCGKAGIEMSTIDNSAAYIASWLRKFKSDPKMAVKAAGQAQKAADHILGWKYESDETTTVKSDDSVAAVAAVAA